MDILDKILIRSFGADGHAVVAAMVLFYLWIAGACVSSFSALAAQRMAELPDGRSLLMAFWRPPSRCDGCGTRIQFSALFPAFGWVIARGRCGACGYSIPALHPITEFVAGAATLTLLLVHDGSVARLLGLLALLWSGIFLSWIEWRNGIVSRKAAIVLLAGGLLFSPFEPEVWPRLAGAAACGSTVLLAMTAMRGRDATSRVWREALLGAAGGAWVGSGAIVLLPSAAVLFLTTVLAVQGRNWKQAPATPALMLAALVAAIAS